MAEVVGIEPTSTVLETAVLPLNNTSIWVKKLPKGELSFKMAGVAGLEPTTGGFEDRSSTIELHPYNFINYKV